MTQTDILEVLRRLTATERLTLIEAALQQICDDLQQMGKPPTQIEMKRQLAAAGEALLADYAAGGELSLCTALDSEDLERRGEVWLVNAMEQLPKDTGEPS